MLVGYMGLDRVHSPQPQLDDYCFRRRFALVTKNRIPGGGINGMSEHDFESLCLLKVGLKSIVLQLVIIRL